MPLSEQQRAEIIERLERGEDLPRDLQHVLFPPERREYELVYAGKERESDILADTMAVPLQPVRTFGTNGGDPWHNHLIFGDNLQAMKTLLAQKKAGTLRNADGSPGVRLIYIDPPFATKQEFRGSQDQKAYQDKIYGARFIEFIRQRLVMMHKLLSDDGCIFVHLDTKKSHYIKIILDEVFKENNFRNEIIWKRQSAHSDSSQCVAIHDTIFFYTNSQQWTWNSTLTEPSPDYVEQFFDQVESETGRRYARGDLSAGGLTGGGYVYEFRGITHNWRAPKSTMERYELEGRLHWPKDGVPRLKRYLDEFKGVSLQDVWNDIRVIHNRSPERVGYPTQKPEALLARIINTSTNEGDIVLDAFAGSGTTCAVAEKLGRRWIAIDSGKLAIYTIQKRMLNLKAEIGNKGRALAPKPFTLSNAGLYDWDSLRELPWDAWRFFALTLFECTDDPHTVSGLKLDGRRRGADVLVFDHLSVPGRRIDRETIRDIHEIVGDKIGDTFYVVAPKGIFDFQEDYLDFGDVRYYALRIPYSFISELHRRGFGPLKQPSDEGAVNDIVDSYGFDFIERPTVGFKTGQRQMNLITESYLKVTEFESRARLRGLPTRGGLETLSMLMLDFDYKDDVFDLDAVFYGHQLAERDWTAAFSPDGLGENIMAVFVDIHGNEARELLPCARFQTPPDASDRTKE